MSELRVKRRWWGVVVVTALGAAALLSACGGPTSKVSDLFLRARSRPAYLCLVLSRVDRLVVTRRAPSTQFVFTFPTVVTVASASAARAVASSACALPDVPAGVFHCPAEFAVSYQLVFAVEGEKGFGGEAIDTRPTGCQLVTGLGAVRTTRYHPGFYTLLAHAMGIQNGGYQTFTGMLKTGG